MTKEQGPGWSDDGEPERVRRAVVTGVGRGLGRAIGAELLSAGWHVVGISRRPDDTGELDASHRFEHVIMDLESMPDIEPGALVSGPLDLMVNNAGLRGPGTAVADTGAAEMLTGYRVHVLAPFLLVKACLPNLAAAPSPTVLNISSRLGSLTNLAAGVHRELRPHLSTAYVASKGALNALTVALADELDHHGIAMYAIHPGTIQTRLGPPGAEARAASVANTLITSLDHIRSSWAPAEFLDLGGPDGPEVLPW